MGADHNCAATLGAITRPRHTTIFDTNKEHHLSPWEEVVIDTLHAFGHIGDNR